MEQPCRAFRGLALFFSRFSQNGFILPPEPPVAVSPRLSGAQLPRRGVVARGLDDERRSGIGKASTGGGAGTFLPLTWSLSAETRNPECPCQGFALISLRAVKQVRNERGACCGFGGKNSYTV